MIRLGEDDPEHWLHVVAAGRSLLQDAALEALSHRHLAGAFMKFCEANVALLGSFVAEARARKLTLIRQLAQDGEADRNIRDQLLALLEVAGCAKTPLNRTDAIM